jgi:anti-sigma B factor antagonist
MMTGRAPSRSTTRSSPPSDTTPGQPIPRSDRARATPTPAYFEIHQAHDGDRLRLKLTGELDLGSAPVLRQRLAQLRAEQRPVRLDLSRLEFMDSTGIHLLLDAYHDARHDGWQLAIDPTLSPRIQRLFKLTGLDRIIPTPPHQQPPLTPEHPRPPQTTLPPTAFDRSLEQRELRHAGETYALRHGKPGTATYRAAWLKFRQHIHSSADLQRLRASRTERADRGG